MSNLDSSVASPGATRMLWEPNAIPDSHPLVVGGIPTPLKNMSQMGRMASHI